MVFSFRRLLGRGLERVLFCIVQRKPEVLNLSLAAAAAGSTRQKGYKFSWARPCPSGYDSFGDKRADKWFNCCSDKHKD